MNSYPTGDLDEGTETSLPRLRQGLYRFFATSLLYPGRAQLSRLAEAASVLAQERLAALAFYSSWRTLARILRDGVDSEAVATDFVRLFSVGERGNLCVPHESAYLAPSRDRTGLIVAEVEREYARLGLVPAAEFTSLPDHVSMELEAMAFLCGREAQARGGGAFDEMTRVLTDERTFLDRHLGRWFPRFASHVLAANPGDFYRAVVTAADAFIKHDVDLLAALMEEGP